MHQLFIDRLPAEGQLYALEGEERHYLGRALRARPGERVRLAAEDGTAATAVLEAFDGDAALLRIGPADPDPPLGLCLGLDLCPPRGDALDEALDMAVQLGLESLRLVVSQRTLANPGQGALSPERLRKRLREACRQCLRARPPTLEFSVSLVEALGQERSGLRLVMSERGGEPLPALADTGSVRLLIGPEGGFAAEELALARDSGWRAVSLGPHILRVPTAVAAALAGLRALTVPPYRSPA